MGVAQLGRAAFAFVAFLPAVAFATPATYYEVWRSDTPDLRTAQVIAEWYQGGTSFTDSSTGGANYYYWVRAITAETYRATSISPFLAESAPPDNGYLDLTVPLIAPRTLDSSNVGTPIRYKVHLTPGTDTIPGFYYYITNTLYQINMNTMTAGAALGGTSQTSWKPWTGMFGNVQPYNKDLTLRVDLGASPLSVDVDGYAGVYAITHWSHDWSAPLRGFDLGGGVAVPLVQRGDLDSAPAVQAVKSAGSTQLTWNDRAGATTAFNSISMGKPVLPEGRNPIYNPKALGHYSLEFTPQSEIVANIKVKLNGDAPVGPGGDDLKAIWKSGIEDTWNNKYEATLNGAKFPIRVQVEWVESGEDIPLTVSDGAGRCNSLKFYADASTAEHRLMAAHEAGHWLGLLDEYTSANNDGVVPPWPLVKSDGSQLTPWWGLYDQPGSLTGPKKSNWQELESQAFTDGLMGRAGAVEPWYFNDILNWISAQTGRAFVLAQSPDYTASAPLAAGATIDDPLPSAVPEPGAGLLMLGFVVSALGRRRRAPAN